MTPRPPKKEPQLVLGLKYSENRFLRFFLYRAQKFTLLLDQLSFWRSPILWLLIFTNGMLFYLLYPSLISEKLPPGIPIFNYALTTNSVLFPSENLFYFLGAFLGAQLFSVYIASRTYYRLKQLSLFILLSSILSTFLFGVTMYKSISLTLPIS